MPGKTICRPRDDLLVPTYSPTIGKLLVTVTVATVLVSTGSSAQTSPSGRGTGGEVERRIPQPAAPAPLDPVPLPQPRASPVESTGGAEFILLGVSIRGATIFDAANLVPTYESMLARRVGSVELEAISAAIVERYRRAGYALATAFPPPQRGTEGIALIQVIEGHVEQLVIEGDDDPATGARARAIAARLLAERPATLASLERALLLIGDLPGGEVGRPRLRPLDLAAGRYELVVPFRMRRLEAAATLDNRGSRDYGPWQLWTSGRIAWLTQEAAWSAQAGVFTAPASPREILYGQASLARSLGDDGLHLRAQVSGSRNIAGGALGDVEARTHSTRLTVNLAYPFMRSRRVSFWGALSADALHTAEDRRSRPFFVDDLRVLRASLTGLHVDARGATTWMMLQTSLGIDALGASAPGALRSRPQADARFAKLRADGTHVQPLLGPWSIELRGAAQVADDTLFSVEEFDLGGARLGRAFEPGALSGERGIGGGIELRFADPITLPRIERTELFAYADGGLVWSNAGLIRSRDHLSSAGLGMRARFNQSWRAEIELGKPLASSVPKLRDQGPRLYFSLSAAF